MKLMSFALSRTFHVSHQISFKCVILFYFCVCIVIQMRLVDFSQDLLPFGFCELWNP